MRFLSTLAFLLIFAFGGLSLCFGQNKPFVINYTKEKFKADNQNWSVSCDENGISYFANDNGLLEFDGSNWFLYEMPDKGGLRAVFAGIKNRIYIGAYEEFGYWETDNKGKKNYHSLSNTLSKDVIHNDEIWRIDTLNGAIYFQSFSKIFKYDGKEISVIKPESAIVLLLKARNRLFIHVVGIGLYELVGDKPVLIKGSELLKNDEVKFVLPYEKDKFLIGASKNGLFVYNNRDFTPWVTPASTLIKDSEINNGISLNNNYIVGTITNGVFIIDENGQLKHHINTLSLLQDNTVLALYADNKDNLWVATDKGIDYLVLNSPLDFYVDPFYVNGAVYTAALNGTNLWIGTNKGLFKYVFDTRTKTYTLPKMIRGSQGHVWDLEKVGNDLLCGHTEGTFLVKENDILKISNIKGGFDFELIRSSGEEILIQSTYSAPVAYKNTGKGWRFSHIVNGFLEPVPDIEQDRLGNIWGAHLKKGVFKLQLNTSSDSVIALEYFDKAKGFDNDKEIQISLFKNRIVFTNGGLIYTYDDLNDTVIPYEKLNSQLDVPIAIKKIIPAKENFYWFIGDNSVTLYKDENDTLKHYFSYDFSGIGLYLSSDYPGIIPLTNDHYLICLENGFAIYHFANALPGVCAEKLMMRKVLISDENGRTDNLVLLSPEENTQIPFSSRNIQFTFASSERNCQPIYRYRLADFSKNFSEWSNESLVDFKRLPYGEYKLIVESKTIEGVFLNPLIYHFEILPPFYLTKSAFAVYSFCLLSLLLLGAYTLKRRFKMHKEKIETVEREKREKDVLKINQRYMDLKNQSLENELNYKNVQLANYAITISHKNDLLIKIKNNVRKQIVELENYSPKSFLKEQIKLLDKHISSEDEWKTFEGYFDQIHRDYFKKLIDKYPDLTQSDLKLCAYLRLNLSSKEIATLLNISLRGVEARRYRLRKRMNFDQNENLVEFFLKF